MPPSSIHLTHTSPLFPTLSRVVASDPQSAAAAAGPNVHRDLIADPPGWCLTCYGHQFDRGNDLTGDVSPEEARWKHYEVICMHRGPWAHGG